MVDLVEPGLSIFSPSANDVILKDIGKTDRCQTQSIANHESLSKQGLAKAGCDDDMDK